MHSVERYEMIPLADSKTGSKLTFLQSLGVPPDAHVMGLLGTDTLVAKNCQLPEYPVPEAKSDAGRVNPFPVSPGAKSWAGAAMPV